MIALLQIVTDFMEQKDPMCLSGGQIIPLLEDLLPALHLFIVLDCSGFESQ
jgi:hypothetical protein